MFIANNRIKGQRSQIAPAINMHQFPPRRHCKAQLCQRLLPRCRLKVGITPWSRLQQRPQRREPVGTLAPNVAAAVEKTPATSSPMFTGSTCASARRCRTSKAMPQLLAIKGLIYAPARPDVHRKHVRRGAAVHQLQAVMLIGSTWAEARRCTSRSAHPLQAMMFTGSPCAEAR